MGTVGLWCQPGLSREGIAEDKNICVSGDIPSAWHADSTEDMRVNQFFSKYKSNKRLVFKNLRRQWQPTSVLLPGKSHGQRSLVGCSPWGR